ncbi:hypothetical protein BJ138DRAFT_1103154 [Hygrophoropsis aurantiaca]|uniref:Uncharacterized protein n=1 Tax=Hygrophoropsis aurantiaca TaxID=72124 RepID=A0ACB8A6M9_9AGAM|nr:hypothetical protein BJ138DRAFT_1103154 [Hygrophoropsis aurantiaca]
MSPSRQLLVVFLAHCTGGEDSSTNSTTRDLTLQVHWNAASRATPERNEDVRTACQAYVGENLRTNRLVSACNRKTVKTWAPFGWRAPTNTALQGATYKPVLPWGFFKHMGDLLLVTKPVPSRRTKPVPNQRTKPVPNQRTKPVPHRRTKPVPHRRTKPVP